MKTIKSLVLFLCMCIVCTCFSPVYAEAGEIKSIIADIDAEIVEISIETDAAETWAAVLVIKPDADTGSIDGASLTDSVSYAGEVQTDKNGKASISYKMKNSPSGIYSVYVRLSGAETDIRDEFFYSCKADIAAAFAAVTQEQTAAALAKNIDDKKDYLYLDSVVWNKLTGAQKEQLCAQIQAKDKTYAEPEEWREDFSRFSAVAAAQYLKNAEVLCGEIEKSYHLFDVEESVYQLYQKQTEQIRMEIAGDIIFGIKDGDLRTAMYDGIICGSIYQTSNWTDVQEIIDNNAALMGLDMTAYSKLNNPSAVIKSLTGVKYNTITELAAAFAKESERLYELEKSGTDTGTTAGSLPSVIGRTEFDKDLMSSEPIVHDFQFIDTDTVPWAIESIESLARMGVINGRAEKLFEPDAEITREEFVKILALAFNIKLSGGECSFEDADKNAYYYPYLSAAAAQGLVQGHSPEIFGIGENITRQDMAVLIYRFALNAETVFDEGGKLPFTDSGDIAQYAVEAVKDMTGAGILNGTDSGSFLPYAFCTRAEAAKAVYSTLKYAQLVTDERYIESVSGVRNAEDSSKYVLTSLGILPEEKEGDSAEYFYTAEMVNILQNLTGGESTAAEQIQEFGSSGEKLGYITYGQTIKTLLDIMGYTGYANSCGGYPQGYLSAAVRIDLIDTGIDMEARITKKEFIDLIYRGADIDVLSSYGYDSDGNVLLVSTEGRNLLSIYHDIHKITGVLTANEITSLGQRKGTGIDSGDVRIGTLTFAEGNSAAGEFLGYRVTAYYYQKDSEKGILMAVFASEDNKVTNIFGDDIAGCSGTELRYYNELGKERSISLPSGIDVIYNGVFLEKFDKDLLKPEYGEVTVIDNDGDGSADAAIVLDFYDLIVNTVDTVNEKVYDKYDADNSIAFRDLDGYTIISGTGGVMEPADITAAEVYAAARSLDGKYVRLIKCDNTVTGTISSYYTKNSDTYAEINGESYKVSDRAAKSGDIGAGESGVFTLNLYGWIIDTKMQSGTSRYGYILNSWKKDNSFGTEAGIRMLDQSGEVMQLMLAERPAIDGTIHKSITEAYTILLDGKASIPAQLVMYSINSAGDICDIDRAYGYKLGEIPIDGELVLGTDEKEDSLHKFYIGKNSSVAYRSIQRSFMGKCTAGETTKVFFVPKDSSSVTSNDDKNIAVGTVADMLNAVSYSADGYKLSSESLEAAALVVYDAMPGSAIISNTTQLFVVKEINSSYVSAENTVLTEISGYQGGLMTKFYAEAKDIPEGLAEGDVIRAAWDKNRTATGISLIFKGETKTPAFSNPTGAFNSAYRIGYGAAVNKYGSIIYVEYGDGTITGNQAVSEYINISGMKIYVVDLDAERAEERVRIGTAEDVKDYVHYGQDSNCVLIRLQTSKACDLVIYE